MDRLARSRLQRRPLTWRRHQPVAEIDDAEVWRRARGTPARGNLHAKTGTTNTVAALGGFVTAKNGEVLAFSLIYNGADRWNAKTAMDQIGATMAEFVRK